MKLIESPTNHKVNCYLKFNYLSTKGTLSFPSFLSENCNLAGDKFAAAQFIIIPCFDETKLLATNV
jgi:hypothetical protein